MNTLNNSKNSNSHVIQNPRNSSLLQFFLPFLFNNMWKKIVKGEEKFYNKIYHGISTLDADQADWNFPIKKNKNK